MRPPRQARLWTILFAGILASGSQFLTLAPVGAAEQQAPRATEVGETSNPADLAETLFRQARSAQIAGDAARAIPLYQRALEASEAASGRENSATAQIHRGLAGAYKAQGRLAEAEIHYRQDLVIQEKFARPGTLDGWTLAQTVEALAEIHEKQKTPEEIEPLLRRGLALVERIYGPDHRQTLHVIEAIGARYAKLGRYSDAEALYTRIVAIHETLLRTGDRAAPSSPWFYVLKRIYREQGRDAEMEAIHKRLLAAAEAGFGPEHARTASFISDLAGFYKEQKRFAEAEPYYRRLLAIVRGMNGDLGDVHLHQALDGLAGFYKEQGRDADAEPLMREKLALLEKKKGTAASETLFQRDALARFLVNLGRHDEAVALLERSVAAVEAERGPNHPDLAQWLGQLAQQQRKRGRTVEAEAVLERVLTILETAAASGAIDLLNDYSARAIDLAALYQEQGKRPTAEKLRQRDLALHERLLGPGHRDLLGPLSRLAGFYESEGRDAEAAPLRERMLALGEKIPDDLPLWDLDTLTFDLARTYARLGRIEEAERLFKQALKLREEAAGPETSSVFEYIGSVQALANLYHGSGRVEEVEPLYARAVEMIDARVLAPANQKAPALLHELVLAYRSHGRLRAAITAAERWLTLAEKEGREDRLIKPLALLGTLYTSNAQHAMAERRLLRALVLATRLKGQNHVDVAEVLSDLATLYLEQARYPEARQLLERALGIEQTLMREEKARRNALGSSVAAGNNLGTTNLLALVNWKQGRYAEAETLFKQLASAELAETVAYANLAALYSSQGRYAEAEPLLKHVHGAFEKTKGPAHPDTVIAVQNLARFHLRQGRLAEAEPLLERVLAARERSNGPQHPDTATSLADLANLYREQGRLAEARPLYERALAIQERTFGPDSLNLADTLADLASLLKKQGAHDEAISGYEHALTIVRSRLGPKHESAALLLAGLAGIHEMRKDWPEAERLLREAVALLVDQFRGDAGTNQETAAARRRVENDRHHDVFAAYLRTAARVAHQQPGRAASLAAHVYETAQWMQNPEAAGALAAMAARFAGGEGKLAAIVRERQDLVGRYAARDRDLLNATSRSWHERSEKQEDDIRDELVRIRVRIKEIDSILEQAYPDYASLTDPEPLSVGNTQAQLAPDEALHLVGMAGDEVFAWVVTRKEMRWRKLEISSEALATTVDALRCGLDASEWREQRAIERTDDTPVNRCHAVLGTERAGSSLPFDLDRAHKLHQTLFAPFRDMIAGKRLLVVPAGPLATLPYQVLVTRAPDPSLAGLARYEQAAWMIREHVLAVLPSVASLKALRRNAGRSSGGIAYAGFANPLLLGPDGADRRAFGHQACPEPGPGVGDQPARLAGLRGAIPDFVRGGEADVTLIRAQAPLPETSDEVCRVRDSLGGGEVFLGERATEAVLKELDGKGGLRRFRVLHFATHGLLAGETEQIARLKAEPALILTPPEQATEMDDGLLMASEIAGLDLDADFVVLSACNTASGSGEAGTRALSGLARAFLYAGSRSLLVSHWYVDSRAAVDLVTAAFEGMGDDRPERLQNAMLGEIAKGGFRAHPSYWAPFILVGVSR